MTSLEMRGIAEGRSVIDVVVVIVITVDVVVVVLPLPFLAVSE